MHTVTPVAPVASYSFRHLQVIALPGLFAWFGIIMGSWAGRIPALRDGLQVSHSALSLILLCGGLGAVISFPVSSRMMARWGGKHTLLYSGLALLAVLVCIGAAPSMPLLMLAVLMLGIVASTFDVAMNSVAAKIETSSGKSSMSRLHAFACAGGLLGTLIGSAMASRNIAPAHHFAMIAVPFIFILWFLQGLLQDGQSSQTIEKKKFCLPRGPLALLGVLGFLGAVAEGSIADWSGLYMKDHFGATDGLAPLALSSFSVMMLITRILGDRLKTRHGASRLISIGGMMAAAGLFFAVFATNAHFALAGFAVAGAGMALVFPFVFSAAGKEGPVALAGVATMAYSGSLMGPPLIGTIADGLGLQVAMGFIGVLSICVTIVACRSALLKE